MTQDQLLQAIWPNTFVQPEVLRKYILEIRRALEDPPRAPRFIETLPKRGYRFIAVVHDDLVGGTPTPPPIHAPANLVGRETVLADLVSRLRATLQGQRQVVFLTGEAGIGKTSMVDAFHAEAARYGAVRIARGQCVEGFGGKESYYPALEAFGLFMRGSGGEALLQTLAAHAPTWLIQFPALIPPDQREMLRREILGASGDRMLREICEALEFFTAEQPLMLILEDLHLADESTLDLISALARRRVAAKLMVLATYRPVEVIARSPLKVLKQDLLIHRLCGEVSLGPLTRLEIEQYLSAEFPESEVGARLSKLIHQSSDGNPLFMVALLERLRRQGWIVRSGERWTLTVPPEQIDLGVPETLQQMLEVQLEHLREAEQQRLRAASVSGWRFSAWAVAAMTETGEGIVEGTFEDLAARQQFILHAGMQQLPDGSVSAQYEFKHSLYREVLFSRLPPIHRRQFHLRLAERMESLGPPGDLAFASEMAAHFEAGREFARATRYLMVSAGIAAQRYAHADSIQILRRAIELLPNLPSQESRALEIEILERISDVLYAQGDMAQSAKMDYKVVELAGQAGIKVAEVNALTRVARALAFLDPDRCVEVCEHAVAVARSHDDRLLLARAEVLRACWRIVTNGWNALDSQACAQALARIHDLSAELPAYHEILFAHVQCVEGDYEGACQTALAGIPKSLETGSLVVFLSAHSSLAHALLHLGRWEELLQVVSAALATAEKNGNAPWVGIFQATLGWLRFQTGDLDGARSMAEALLQTHTEEPAGQVRTMAMVISGFVELADQVPNRALPWFQQVCARQKQPRFFLDWYWRIVGRLGLSQAWLMAGDLALAGAEAGRALEAALATAEPTLKALAWEIQTRIAMGHRDWSRAKDSLRNAYEVLSGREASFAAWRVHAAAVKMHELTGEEELAEQSRTLAAAVKPPELF